MEKDEVRLESEIRIRRLEKQELDFLRKDKIIEFRKRVLKASYENVLEMTSSAPSPAGALEVWMRKGRVLTTLRLFKQGHVFSDISIPSIDYDMLKDDVREAFVSSIIAMSTFQPELYITEKPPYSLKKGEIKQLVTFHDTLTSIKPPSDLSVAMSWFNQALETAESLDCMIKHIVALEAIYLEGGPELAYRLSNRVSSFVGTSPHERLLIKHRMKEFYNMRSKIIHGGKRSSIIPVEFLLELEGYVRISVLKMLALRQRYKKKHELLGLIEDSIFDDMKRAQLEKEAEEFYGFKLYQASGHIRANR